MADRQTVAGAYAEAEKAQSGLKAHEDLCAERYKNINDTLGEVRGAIKGHGRAAWGIVLALLGWMAVQLWNAEVRQPEPPPTHAPR